MLYLQDTFNKDVFLQLSYLGPGVAAIISIRLFKMEKSSFINKMFLLYFSLDIFAGLVHTFYLQKIVTEKYDYQLFKDHVNPHTAYELYTP